MTEGAKGGDALASVIAKAHGDWRYEADQAQWSGGTIKPPASMGNFIAARIREHMLSDASVERVANAAFADWYGEDVLSEMKSSRRAEWYAVARAAIAALLDGGARDGGENG